MILLKWLSLLVLLCLFVSADAHASQTVVAADGSGDFKTVQQAVDQVPDNNTERVVIQIKPGVYHEQGSGRRRQRSPGAAKAVEKGIDCILKTQVVIKDRRGSSKQSSKISRVLRCGRGFTKWARTG